MQFGEFDEELKKRAGKPFYIPRQEDLLKYKDDNYFEINNEYKALLDYVTKHLFDGNESKAEMLVEDIQGHCLHDFLPREIFDLFNVRDVSF